MVSPEDDFRVSSQDERDIRLASLVDSVMDTKVGKDRKSHLTQQQALMVARARAFADSFVEYDDKGNQIESALNEIHLVCDYLENTAVSVQGKGLNGLIQVLTHQLDDQERSELDKLRTRIMN